MAFVYTCTVKATGNRKCSPKVTSYVADKKGPRNACNSVIAEMSLLLFGFLLLHLLSNCISSKQSGLEKTVTDGSEETEQRNLNCICKVDELLQRLERMDISWKLEKAYLEGKLES